MNAVSSVTILAKNPDGTPFDGELFVVIALPKNRQDEEPRLDAHGFVIPVPAFKEAQNYGNGVYKLKLLKNHVLAPRGTKYAVFASNNSKDPVNCLTFVADSDDLSVEAEVRL